MPEATFEATLDAVLDRILPADEHGPGALEAGVGRYVREALAGAYAEELPAYRAGLGSLDARAEELHGTRFALLDPARQDALLLAAERSEAAPDARAAAAFFELVRRHAIEGMFGDPAWGGNADGAGWDLIGYPGPRLVWTEADQRPDATPARTRPPR